jgi:hypothetical protein
MAAATLWLVAGAAGRPDSAANITPWAHSQPFAASLMTLSRRCIKVALCALFPRGLVHSLVSSRWVRSIGFISKITPSYRDVQPGHRGDTRGKGTVAGALHGILPDHTGGSGDADLRMGQQHPLLDHHGFCRGPGLVFFRQMAMLNYGGVATVILAVRC